MKYAPAIVPLFSHCRPFQRALLTFLLSRFHITTYASAGERVGPSVYVLFLKKRAIYVGESSRPAARLDEHRRAGLLWDDCVFLRSPLFSHKRARRSCEAGLISALSPSKNR